MPLLGMNSNSGRPEAFLGTFELASQVQRHPIGCSENYQPEKGMRGNEPTSSAEVQWWRHQDKASADKCCSLLWEVFSYEALPQELRTAPSVHFESRSPTLLGCLESKSLAELTWLALLVAPAELARSYSRGP